MRPLVVALTVTLFAAPALASEFCDGFREGFSEGVCTTNPGPFCEYAQPPPCPYNPKNRGYRAGYDRGYERGKQEGRRRNRRY